MNIRLATAADLMGMQAGNLQNLPENYTMKVSARFTLLLLHLMEYAFSEVLAHCVSGIYHAMTWPQISFVAEDHKGRIVGYVLAKINDDEDDRSEVHGHVNSISVLRSYRRLGLAKKLMLLSQEAMATIYKAQHVSLHVRRSNKAAIGLYRDTLGFEVHKVEKKYYGDGEDAFSMRLSLKGAQ